MILSDKKSDIRRVNRPHPAELAEPVAHMPHMRDTCQFRGESGRKDHARVRMDESDFLFPDQSPEAEYRGEESGEQVKS